MTATTKLIIFALAALMFLVGAIVLAVMLFGSSGKKNGGGDRRFAPERADAPMPWQAAAMPAPHGVPAPGAQQGRISYGNATQMVNAAQPVGAVPRGNMAAPVNVAPQPMNIPVQRNMAQPANIPQPMNAVPQRGMAPPAGNAVPFAAVTDAMCAAPVGAESIRLTITGDNGAPEYFVDVARSELPVTIGRGKSDARGRSIVVNEPTVSFQHVCLEERNGILSVRDCRSTCGTVIDGGDGGSVVLKNEAKETRTNIYAGSFTMVLGRMKVRAELSEAFLARALVGCRLTLRTVYNGAPVGGGSYCSSFSIGRKDVELSLKDLMVSRLHAKVQRTVDGRFILSDQGSRNGVFDARSGRRITETELTDGSVIRIGDTELHVDSVVCGIPGAETPAGRPRTVYVDSVSSAANPHFV